MEEVKWYAVYVKPRQEKKVARLLADKNLAHYLPLIKVKKQWSDRLKTVEIPLLSSYIFLPNTTLENFDMKRIDGVVNYVYSNGKLAVIYAHEIDRIKSFLGELIVTEEQYHHIVIGSKVELNQGAFVGKKGEVIALSKKKLKLEVESLGYILEIHIDRNEVRLVT